MTRKSKSISYTLEKKVITSLGILIIGLIIVYSYFVMFSVSHVVLREEIVHENEKLDDEVSRLEMEYLAHSGEFTQQNAVALGFSQVTAKTFVERGSYSLRDAQ